MDKIEQESVLAGIEGGRLEDFQRWRGELLDYFDVAVGLRGRQKAFGQFLEKQLRAEWHVVIMLAYLEIVLATAMGIDQGPTDLGFWELGDSWSRA